MPAFSDLLAGFERLQLDESSSSIAAVTPDGVIRWVNRAWRRRAEACAVGGDPVSANYLGAISGELRPFFEDAFAVALRTRTVFELDYACPSPEEQRSFRLRALPLDGGLLLDHTLIATAPADEGEAAIEANYRDPDGILVQCSNCRRVLHRATSAWHWVAAWVKETLPRVSHGLCAPCTGFYWGRRTHPNSRG